MQIRDLSPADSEAAIALWHQAGLTRPWNPPDRDLRRALDGRTSTVLGAFEAERFEERFAERFAERLVGTVMVGHDGHRGWVYYLAVEPSRRGTGVGKQLMTAAEAWLRKNDAVKVQLMVRSTSEAVRSTNEAVLGFYDRLGYLDEDVRVRSKWLIEPGSTGD